MTLQEHFERLRKSVGEFKLGGLQFADLGRAARYGFRRVLRAIGALDLGGLVTDLRVGLVFYTRLPLRLPATTGGAALARASWCVPLVGALIGLLAGIAYWAAYRLNLPQFVSATLAVAVAALLTGCLHEDGLADTADGLGGTTREQALVIMRDGRIGVFGACALIICFALRIGALADLPNAALVAWALVGAHAAGRAGLPLFMRLMRPARADGLSAEAGAPPSDRAWVSVAIGVVLLIMALGLKNALIALLLLVVSAAVVAWIAWRKIGGQTGDVLGAIEQVGECVVLLVTAARF